MLVKLVSSVNFFNILCSTFLYKSALSNFSLVTIWLCNFCRKNIGQMLLLKCWWNWFLVSISPMFYVRIIHTNVILAAFSSYILALSKNLYKKCARKTLMKLTTGVKAYQCKVCDRQFSSQSNMIAHSSVHDSTCPENRSVNNSFNKSNVEKIRRNNHICVECGAEFRLKVRNSIEHVLTKTRPFLNGNFF